MMISWETRLYTKDFDGSSDTANTGGLIAVPALQNLERYAALQCLEPQGTDQTP